MRFEIVGKNISVTEGMRTKIEEKLGFLDKYILIDPNVIARVVCRVYPIDLAIDKLEDQIRRQKTRLSRRHKDSLAESFIEKDEKVLEEEDIAVKTKTITPEKMDLEEAIMRMEMLGHSFFIYVDNENDEIAVVYRRNDGKYGLIETER